MRLRIVADDKNAVNASNVVIAKEPIKIKTPVDYAGYAAYLTNITVKLPGISPYATVAYLVGMPPEKYGVPVLVTSYELVR